MTELSEAIILDTLKAIPLPAGDGDLVSSGMIQGLVVRDGNVGFTIEVDPAEAEAFEAVRKAAEDAVLAMDGVTSVTAVLTAHSDKPATQPGAQSGGAGQAAGARQAGGQMMLPTVKHIVAVASGKGGVGKSTTSANIALALAASGKKVGLLDADIFGPSMPLMLGINDRPTSDDGKILNPLENHGLKVMSIGFLVPADAPTIWRGPMVMGALEQMLRDVAWGDLDILIVDMPPGTGDAQLTMAQRVALDGALIVSTPQDLALIDARKGLNMFRKVDVPVLGIVENMSYFICPKCGERSEIFTHGGAQKAAAEMGVDFLGEIPLDMAIRETSDSGAPIVVSDPNSPHTAAYAEIAEKLWTKVAGGTVRAAPNISIS